MTHRALGLVTIAAGVALSISLLPFSPATAVDDLQDGRIPSIEEVGERDDGTGNFRTLCLESHINFDDPLVFPNQSNATHEHVFFGNPSTDAYSTIDSLMQVAETTCDGEGLNRSAYWVPSIYDAFGERMKFDDVLFYYKSGFHISAEEIQAPPAGLRMIAGNAKSSVPQDVEIAKYRCEDWVVTSPQFDPGDPQDHVAYIPKCDLDDALEVRIVFPQCWDGLNLDSPDHRSHMAYPIEATAPFVGTGRCPDSHPVAIPEISYNFAFYISQEAGPSDQWRLSSDMYADGPGGYSTHADWMNGWDPAIMDILVDNCINKSLECGVGNLGDGTRLTPILDDGAAQDEPELYAPDLFVWNSQKIRVVPGRGNSARLVIHDARVSRFDRVGRMIESTDPGEALEDFGWARGSARLATPHPSVVISLGGQDSMLATVRKARIVNDRVILTIRAIDRSVVKAKGPGVIMLEAQD